MHRKENRLASIIQNGYRPGLLPISNPHEPSNPIPFGGEETRQFGKVSPEEGHIVMDRLTTKEPNGGDEGLRKSPEVR